MTNLSDFLKCEKVRCVVNDVSDLTKNAIYDVRDFSVKIKILDDVGDGYYYPVRCFAPVLETAIQAADSLNDTPMGTRTEFKVGDSVYLPNLAGGKILNIKDNKACHYPFFVNVTNHVNNSLYELDSNGKTKYGNFTDIAIHATPENHELLCKLYPHIEFEAPPKELTGSDLCRAMLDRGWEYVPCYISADSDSMAKATKNEPALIYGFAHGRFLLGADSSVSFVCPFDPKTGQVLTSEVLDD